MLSPLSPSESFYLGWSWGSLTQTSINVVRSTFRQKYTASLILDWIIVHLDTGMYTVCGSRKYQKDSYGTRILMDERFHQYRQINLEQSP